MKKLLLPPLLVSMALLLGCPAKPQHAADSKLPPSQDVTIVARATKIAQLVGDYDRQRQQPTANLTQSRVKLAGADLGVPYQHKGRTYVLFGDSLRLTNDGRAVGYGDAVAYTTDRTPEDGIDLTFPTDASGTYQPLTVPGISQGPFEVPMEGISVGGRMYVYLTTDHSDTVTMGRSVLAVSDDDGNSFRYLYDLSTRHFINVSVVEVDPAAEQGLPHTAGKGLAMFGSGLYRQSSVRLAFQPSQEIEARQSILYFAGQQSPGQPLWSSHEEDAQPLFAQACAGELSVSYNRFIDRWIMLYSCDNPRGINMRSADHPWGPWSEPQVLFDPWADAGYCHFIHASSLSMDCDSVHDPGRENEWGGEYGPYQFEDLAVGSPGKTTIYFTMSTWNPYTVVLMKATLQSPWHASICLPIVLR